jgi:hypothetical protein
MPGSQSCTCQTPQTSSAQLSCRASPPSCAAISMVSCELPPPEKKKRKKERGKEKKRQTKRAPQSHTLSSRHVASCIHSCVCCVCLFVCCACACVCVCVCLCAGFHRHARLATNPDAGASTKVQILTQPPAAPREATQTSGYREHSARAGAADDRGVQRRVGAGILLLDLLHNLMPHTAILL